MSFPGDETMRVSRETIYRSLFIQARGVLKKELVGNSAARVVPVKRLVPVRSVADRSSMPYLKQDRPAIESTTPQDIGFPHSRG